MFKDQKKRWIAISGISMAVAMISFAVFGEAADERPEPPAAVAGDKCWVTLRKVDRNGEALIELSREVGELRLTASML